MAEGVELRAQMDIETFKGLLVINGGGAVALLTFFAAILTKDSLYTRALAPAILWALMTMVFGLGFAIAHNFFRRRCSLAHDQRNVRRLQQRLQNPQQSLQEDEASQPTVCTFAWSFLWCSLACFMGAVFYVAYVGLSTFSGVQAAPVDWCNYQ
jgi:hypothetical protein